jgi:hypothetical protein
MMDIILSTEAVDVQECEILVTGLFQDERPLKGSCGWIDWRLNGKLSHFLIDQRLTGSWKETTLIPSEGRVTPTVILLIGLGGMRDYSYLRVRELCPYLLEILRKMCASSFNLSLPCGANYQVDCGKLAEVFIEGMADGLQDGTNASDVEWLKNIRLFLSEGKESFAEMLIGVQTAKAIVEHRLPIRIFVPSEKDRKGSETRSSIGHEAV